MIKTINGKIIGVTPGKSGIRINRQIKKRYEINTKTGCWEWLLYKMPNGYGQTWNYRTRSAYPAHRLFYENEFGILSSKIVLDHLCRNKACVNPKHLESVTQQINTQRGIKAKLNPEKVLKIRNLFKNGMKQKEISNLFKIGADEISRIINFKRWGNIPKTHGQTNIG